MNQGHAAYLKTPSLLTCVLLLVWKCSADDDDGKHGHRHETYRVKRKHDEDRDPLRATGMSGKQHAGCLLAELSVRLNGEGSETMMHLAPSRRLGRSRLASCGRLKAGV